MNTFSYLPRIVLSAVMALSLWAFTPKSVSATSAPMAETAEEQATSEQRREAARIAREREVRLNEINKDRELREKA